MQEIFPTADSALALARRFLSAKHAEEADLPAFEEACRQLSVPVFEQKARIAAHVERMHNAGRMSAEQAAEQSRKLFAYANGHAERMRAFLGDWLDRAGASPEAELRCRALRARLDRAMGG